MLTRPRLDQFDPPSMLFSVYPVEVPDSEEMPHVENLDFLSCPGCGNRLGENDLKCSSCSLDLSPTDHWRCSNCDEVIEAKVAVCPHCGGGIDWSEK